MNVMHYFKYYLKHIFAHLVFIYLAWSLSVQASDFSDSSSALLKSGGFGPVAKDCGHERILCFESNTNVFAVKGPMTSTQVNNLCPSTPNQAIFKWLQLPSNLLHAVIIAKVGDSVFAYNPDQYRVQKSSIDKPLPKFSYVLCGTGDSSPNYGRHVHADNPVPLDDFLANSPAFDNIKNLPSNKVFKAADRTFAFREVMLGDSLAYLMGLFPSAEVNYEISGNQIAGYDFSAEHGGILAKFDKQERLYEFTSTSRKQDISFTEILKEFVNRYGNPVMKGGATIEHDLDPQNKRNANNYIWKLDNGAYLTLTIDTTKAESVTVKMLDIIQAEKAAKDVSN